MTFSQHFLRVLVRRPNAALAALYWHLTRRKVRARNRLRVASVDLPFAYHVWIGANESEVGTANALAELALQPPISIVLYATEPFSDEQMSSSVRSVEAQVYSAWDLVQNSSCDVLASIAAAAGDFILPLRIGDRLAPHALFRIAEALQSNPSAIILYGDEDQFDSRGRRSRPWFKPLWNEELFLAQDYLCGAMAIKSTVAIEAAKRVGGNLSALLLEATATAKGAIVHVPHILCHAAERSDASISRVAAVAAHLKDRRAECSLGPFGTVKVQWPLPTTLPLVTMIIPTRDKVELLRPCVKSLLERTDYPNFEMLIVDNGSEERATAEYLDDVEKDPRVRVLRYHAPFNYSAINNFAVKVARGTFICLLNNDTEVLEPRWLSELMRYAVRPHIGAAGAKLLYDDGTIQHAGVVVGIGEAAGHAHRFLRADQPGYFAMAHSAQYVSAVTGACLLVEKRKFEAVGGLDENGLAVAFNDVDLCLKLQAARWRNVYVPHAVLIHHESKSRESDMATAQLTRYRRELALLQNRWGTKTYADPLHNPNLDRYSETFVFRL